MSASGINLATAYVNIVPSAKGIKGSIQKTLDPEAQSAGTSAGEKAGSSLASKLKGALVAAGIGTFIKSTLEAGGNLQQSFGGLDTLYEEAAAGAKKYASEAAKAGISANAYAEQAVSFGASLKAAYGGDTTKAMEAANLAILDMADNAAKMGTPLESIQNAYQGFAKQNYTMLDNLKLGYGGTKQEMERLLKDAQKLTGVKYDINNLGDVYSAIHVIQDELHLSGVAAEEAKSTFTGSFGAMKAAAENLMANISLGENITPSLLALGETVGTFLTGNLLPMIGNIVGSIPEILAQGVPMLLDTIRNILSSAVGTIGEGLPNLIDTLLNILSSLVGQIADYLPEFVNSAVQIVTSMISGLFQKLPDIVNGILTMAGKLVEAFLSIDWLDLGKKLVLGVLDGIKSLIMNIPQIFANIWNMLVNGAKGAWDGICSVFSGLANFFGNIFGAAWQAVKNVFSAGGKIFDGIKEGIVNAFKAVVNVIIGGINKVVAIPFNAINWALEKLRSIDIFGLKPFGWINLIGVPQLPYLERGGVLKRGQTGLLEGNGAEAVVPLERNKMWISAVANDLKTALLGANNASEASIGERIINQTINIYQPVQSPAETARAIKTTMKYGLAGE